jgi:hypothetical protein
MSQNTARLAWLIVALLALGGAAWLLRYDVTAAPTPARPYGLKLDRWTGRVQVVSQPTPGASASPTRAASAPGSV